MSKGRVASIVLLAFLLVADSAPRDASPAGERPAAGAGSVSPGDVAVILGRANPSLSKPERARIGSAVLRYSTKYQLDPELVTAVLLVESGARPWVRSPKGAIGLMQVMPHMAHPLGMAGNVATIESNVEAGCLILAHNIERLGENDGISAYFWGSNIRGGGYLRRVQAARADVRRQLES